MKLKNWSVVSTSDKKGVAIIDYTIKNSPEICVAIREGKLEVRVYTLDSMEPIVANIFPLNVLQGEQA